MFIDRTRRRIVVGIALLGLSLGATAEALLDELINAVANDRVDEVKRLLARGMDADSVDANGETMLCIAAHNGYARVAQALLAARAHPNTPNRFGDTPLMLAALKGDLDTVRVLQEGGAAVNRQGWTPLIYAATGGHDRVVEFLLLHGADIDAQSPNGTTALMMAIHEHHPDTARLLIDRGADVERRNQDGATALEWAKLGNENDLVKELRRVGARG
jgi:ankyrin repeat protein